MTHSRLRSVDRLRPSPVSRRAFLQTGASTLAAAALPAWMPRPSCPPHRLHPQRRASASLRSEYGLLEVVSKRGYRLDWEGML